VKEEGVGSEKTLRTLKVSCHTVCEKLSLGSQEKDDEGATTILEPFK
jgi:hypothetical protein